jgi:hypothetical protein
VAKPSSSRNRSIEAILSEFAASAPPILPGQSTEQYQAGLQSLISELQAQTPMQVYLAQKMFDCMWWLRTYDIAKHSAIAEMMISILKLDANAQEDWPVMRCLRGLDWNDVLVSEAAQQRGHTVQSLHALATTRSRDKLLNLEQLSAIRTKTLNQLQASYEGLVSRPILNERLKLQNQLMARDLGVIEMPETGRPT